MTKKFVLEFDSQEEMDAFIDKASSKPLADKELDDIMWDRMDGLRGESFILFIKAIRTMSGCGLWEAKKLDDLLAMMLHYPNHALVKALMEMLNMTYQHMTVEGGGYIKRL